jgi:hypothetical protein
MVTASQIREHQEVVGSDGAHVGTVDHVEGTDQIKLTMKDPASKGSHHFIPLSWVASVEQQKIKLNKSGKDAMASWR